MLLWRSPQCRSVVGPANPILLLSYGGRHLSSSVFRSCGTYTSGFVGPSQTTASASSARCASPSTSRRTTSNRSWAGAASTTAPWRTTSTATRQTCSGEQRQLPQAPSLVLLPWTLQAAHIRALPRQLLARPAAVSIVCFPHAPSSWLIPGPCRLNTVLVTCTTVPHWGEPG